MLLTNQRLDKLAAARIDFNTRGKLDSPFPPQDFALPQAHDGDDADNDDPVTEPQVLSDVYLAHTPGKFLSGIHRVHGLGS